jgi:hypothetical protein
LLDCFGGIPIGLILPQVLQLDLFLIELLLLLILLCCWQFLGRWFENFKFLISLDFIWLSRNKLIFEGLKRDPVKASKRIAASLEFHLSVWSGFILLSFWSAPPSGLVKGNFDVAIS